MENTVIVLALLKEAITLCGKTFEAGTVVEVRSEQPTEFGNVEIFTYPVRKDTTARRSYMVSFTKLTFMHKDGQTYKDSLLNYNKYAVEEQAIKFFCNRFSTYTLHNRR